MAFLTATDYEAVIEADDLSIYTGSSPDSRERAEQGAQEEVASYLRHAYDVGAIFSAQATDRNAKIVEVMVDLAIWNLLASHTYREVSEVRNIRKKDAIAWLLRVQSGQLSPELPRYAPETGKGRTFRSGSLPLRSHLL